MPLFGPLIEDTSAMPNDSYLPFVLVGDIHGSRGPCGMQSPVHWTPA